MTDHPEHDDHLPAPVDPARKAEAKQDAANSAPRHASSRMKWGEGALLVAVGVLAGFTAAYLYLEKAQAQGLNRPGAGAQDPHAGVPGFNQDSGGMPGANAPAPNLALEKKILDLQAAVEKDPRNYDLLVQLGNAAFDVENARLAADSYEKALSVKAGDPNVLTDLGVSYRNLGEFDRANQKFEEAMRIDPVHWQALFNQVIVAGFDQGNTEKAKGLLAELKKLQASNPQIPPLDRLEKALSEPQKK